MIELNRIVSKIHAEAKRLRELRLNNDVLIRELNTVTKERLDSLSSKYSNSEGKPVNSLRSKIIEHLKKGTSVGIEEIDLLIEEAESQADKNSFKAWGYFSILYPIIKTEFSFDIKSTIRQLGHEIIQKLNINNSAAKPFVVNFNGPRNFGTDHVWMAIYNKANSSQKTAIQLFFQIDYRGLSCHLYDRLHDDFIKSKKIEEDSDIKKQVIDFFDSVKNRMIEDHEIKKDIRYRKIGVKTNSIYKISHSIEPFPTLKELQYCIDQKIVVVHEKAIDEDGKSDYENFKRAKAGDLFYLCWDSSRLLFVGQFIDDNIQDYKFKDEKGWKQRKYRFLFESVTNDKFEVSTQSWTPSAASTCTFISTFNYSLANNILFRKYFRAELIRDFDTELILPEYGAASRQKITIDELGEPKLEVDIIADELAGIIDNLKSNKGQMLGIFGSWGRGKTFLYDRLKDNFEKIKDLEFEYEHIVFNAWKYQETETIWAHLYGELLNAYVGNSWYPKKLYKLFLLNLKRKGYWPLVSIFGSFLISVIIAYFVSLEIKQGIANYVVGLVGVIGVINGVRLYYKYYEPLKATIVSYADSYNFNEILGIQAEIQQELIVLMQHWLDSNKKEWKLTTLIKTRLGVNKKQKKKRLLLFVDDIDRCREEKIIQIIDALRVMLDNDELIERIVVLVAVDEFLLERAIKHKYNKNFENDVNDANDANDDYISKYLIEEYMDKLFISGIKLPKLGKEEQSIILRNYAVHNKILGRIQVKEEQPEELVETETETENLLNGSIEDDLEYEDIKSDKPLRAQQEFFLLEKELALLEKYASLISNNITPRQLRIYMYRYLLAKNIASKYLVQETREGQLSDNYCDFIARAIAKRSNETKSFNFTDDVSLNLISNEKLKQFTPKLIEIVVPY